MKNSVLMGALATLIIAGGASQVIASGEGHKHGGHHKFEELDANGDGSLSREEMETHMQKRFEGADADGNGELSKDELVNRILKRQAKRADKYASHMIERHDANGDGVLSLEEMRDGRAGKMFAKADANGDGTVSAEEFKAAKQKHGHGKHTHGDAESHSE